MKSLQGKTSLVTGGSRGVGKGIAKGLGESGSKVYLIGRSKDIHQAAEAVNEAGGTGVAVTCNHKHDKETQKVFDLIKKQDGRLDILVNNVWGGYEKMFNENGDYIWEQPFWEQPIDYWDLMFASGVRAHYINSHYAAKLMIRQGNGLIINISFWAAQKYVNNVAYGVSKAATNKLTFDTAQDLKPYNVTVISLYPGLVRTERVMQAAEYLDLSNSESPEFIGRVISALAYDSALFDKTGSVQVAAQLGIEYDITDTNDNQPTPLTLEDV